MSSMVHGYRKADLRSRMVRAGDAARRVVTSTTFYAALLLSAPWLAAFVYHWVRG